MMGKKKRKKNDGTEKEGQKPVQDTGPKTPVEEKSAAMVAERCGSTELFHLVSVSVIDENGKPWKGVYVRVHDGKTYDDSITNESGSVICKIGKSNKEKTVGFSVLGTFMHQWMTFFGKESK